METCNFTHFMKVFEPWLNRDYIRKVYLDADGNLRLIFVDGGEKMFRIDDCRRHQLDDIFKQLNTKNVPIEKFDPKLSNPSACNTPEVASDQ